MTLRASFSGSVLPAFRLDVAVNRVFVDGSPAQAHKAASRMRSMMRTRAFSSSSDEDDAPAQGARSGAHAGSPSVAGTPSGSLGVEARRLSEHDGSSAPDSQRGDAPSSASAGGADGEAERGWLQEVHRQRDGLAQALELALAEAEQLKR